MNKEFRDTHETLLKARSMVEGIDGAEHAAKALDDAMIRNVKVWEKRFAESTAMQLTALVESRTPTTSDECREIHEALVNAINLTLRRWLEIAAPKVVRGAAYQSKDSHSIAHAEAFSGGRDE